MAHSTHADHSSHGDSHGAHHAPSYYVKIWAILLGLLIVSIMGPMLGNKMLTVFTAFGIAIVKALMVAAFFMHLNIEKRFVWYMLFTMLGMVALFFWAVSPDVGRMAGRNWINAADQTFIQTNLSGEEEEHAGEGAAAHEPGQPEGAKEK